MKGRGLFADLPAMQRTPFRKALGLSAAIVLTVVAVAAVVAFTRIDAVPAPNGRHHPQMTTAVHSIESATPLPTLRYSTAKHSANAVAPLPPAAGSESDAPWFEATPFIRAASTEVDAGVQSTEGDVAPPTVAPAVINQYDFRIEPSFREQINTATARRGQGRLKFPVSDNRTVDLSIVRKDVQDGGNGVVYGYVNSDPMADVVLAYVGEAVAGSIVTPEGELFQVQYVGSGVTRVLQLDPSQIREDNDQVLPPASYNSMPRALADAADPDGVDVVLGPTDAPQVAGDAAPVIAGDVMDTALRDGGTQVIDMVIVYTPNSRANNGGTSGIVALINSAVARANLAHANSQTGIVLRVVHTAEVTYNSAGSLGTDLGYLQNPSDGRMDEVYTLRATYNADLVSLFVPAGGDGTAGIAYLNNVLSSGAGAYNYAFSTIADIYATGNLTFAHEVGHNLGAGHAATEGSGVFSYSYGWRWWSGGTQYRSVMAYAPGNRVPWFSNPDVLHLGAATGTATANNALTMRRTRAGMASFKVGAADWTVLAQGDFNADSKPDLIWRQQFSGRTVAWLMDNTTRNSTPALWPATNPGDSDWIAMVNADLNGDNKTDMVWRNNISGRVVAWFMDGVTRTSTGVIWPATNPGDSVWIPMAGGDFNGDTKPDLVWRNSTTGRVIVWYMDGITRTGTAPIWSPVNPGDDAWIPMVAGDFNGDTKPDLIFRNSLTGRVIIWYMDGVTRTGTYALWAATNPGESAWRPMAAGDFNADGKTDIVWRNTDSGRTVVWYMNGSTLVSTAVIWS
jgi:hypothetical protein